MITELIGQFVNSPAAQDAIKAVTDSTSLDAGQAEQAVKATAEGLAENAQGGGLLGNVAGMLSGGGLGGLLGGSTADDLAPAIGKFVASKIGISEDMATSAVRVALPKLMEFIKQ